MSIDFSFSCDKWPGIGKLIEECGEVLQVAGKLIVGQGEDDRWGTRAISEHPTTTQDLETELGDLLGILTYVMEDCPVDEEKILARAQDKLAKFRKWRAELGPSAVRLT